MVYTYQELTTLQTNPQGHIHNTEGYSPSSVIAATYKMHVLFTEVPMAAMTFFEPNFSGGDNIIGSEDPSHGHFATQWK
ncbi:hypothetical protein Peur_045002 [Populus x canadensis]